MNACARPYTQDALVFGRVYGEVMRFHSSNRYSIDLVESGLAVVRALVLMILVASPALADREQNRVSTDKFDRFVAEFGERHALPGALRQRERPNRQQSYELPPLQASPPRPRPNAPTLQHGQPQPHSEAKKARPTTATSESGIHLM